MGRFLESQARTSAPECLSQRRQNHTTTRVYGTTLSDSGIASSLLKRTEIYPDSDVADPLANGADGIYDRIEFEYNTFGQINKEVQARLDLREAIITY